MMCICLVIWHPEEKHQLQGLLSSSSQVMPLTQTCVFLAAEFGSAPGSASGGHLGLDGKVVATSAPPFAKSHTFQKPAPRGVQVSPSSAGRVGSVSKAAGAPGPWGTPGQRGAAAPGKRTPYAQTPAPPAWSTSLRCTHGQLKNKKAV